MAGEGSSTNKNTSKNSSKNTNKNASKNESMSAGVKGGSFALIGIVLIVIIGVALQYSGTMSKMLGPSTSSTPTTTDDVKDWIDSLLPDSDRFHSKSNANDKVSQAKYYTKEQLGHALETLKIGKDDRNAFEKLIGKEPNPQIHLKIFEDTVKSHFDKMMLKLKDEKNEMKQWSKSVYEKFTQPKKKSKISFEDWKLTLKNHNMADKAKEMWDDATKKKKSNDNTIEFKQYWYYLKDKIGN